jgi:ABC-2 type transport system permease protein
MKGPLFWSIRRELWENRSIYVAPLIVAEVIALASIGAVRHNLQPDKLATHDELVAGALMGTTLLVAIFYCLDSLYGERRDRSVLFWKSMPVSDWTAVLSKMTVPMIVLPVVTFVLTIVTQLIMLLASTTYLSMHGQSAAALWQLPWLHMTTGMLYHLITVHSLYYAPIFGWLLLVSAWAKRMPFLWAFLPLAAIGIMEKIAFNTTRFANMLASRISGGMEGDPAKGSRMMMLWPSHPLEFLTRPGLWIGLVIAAACIAGAVRLRRYRDPI